MKKQDFIQLVKSVVREALVEQDDSVEANKKSLQASIKATEEKIKALNIELKNKKAQLSKM